MNRLSVPADRPVMQEAFWTWIQQLLTQAVIDLLEKVMLLERDQCLQAGWNKRATARKGYRNGFYRRRLVTPNGRLAIRVPRCRRGGPDCSMIFDRYQRRVQDVTRVMRHAYLLGCSTRGTAELVEQIFGESISHQTVSRAMRWLNKQLVGWRKQLIDPDYEVIYIDGMHVGVLGRDRMVMIVAGQRRPGDPLEVLGFCTSTGEQCTKLLQDLRDRGLKDIRLAVSDESGAIRSALENVYPEVPWQSCTFHRLKALREAVGPTDYRGVMVGQAARIFRCPSRRAALEAAVAWAERWKKFAPSAVRKFLGGLPDSLQYYSLPKEWWRRSRTNNPLERLIRTLRMRLDNMGCFHDVSAVERAVFGQLARWHKIELTHNS